MKRLYYITKDLDDAEEISDEVHASGIDDHHFYVLSRDDNGIKTHHLHGGSSLERAHIITGAQKALIAGAVAAGVLILFLTFFTSLFERSSFVPFALICIIAITTTVIVKMTGGSFDNYFMTMFNQHLDDGEVVIVIDVERSQAHRIEEILEHHPKAEFIADCSSVGSPIPD
ncbi:hypothetical protein [Vibrio nigripulchritudo]|uniref:hypothetical protein n=1 Tax=Vibrio nigripulchritudo TaxID=28173 RepID=UPI00057161D8|nr:hypothetical protein [Vibrio nigripulchritudo]